MASNLKLDLESCDKLIDWSLLYLATSRLEIIRSVCLCVRFHLALRESHLKAMKRIFKYLAGTKGLGPSYLRGNNLKLIEYFDANYTFYKVDSTRIHWVVPYALAFK